jgi:threonine dehydrogenase-like Zn-dependent dehydrogenase
VYQLLRLLEAGRIEPHRAITHRFEPAEVTKAFALLLQAGESLKSVVFPNGIGAGG